MPTQLAQGAAVAHEAFLAYTNAGFTEDQALRFIAYYLACAN